MQQADKFKTLGITPPKGCLMYGPPGEVQFESSIQALTARRNGQDSAGEGLRGANKRLLPEASGTLSCSGE